MQSKVIILLGPVGAGKTTQAKLLCRNLRKRGYRVSSAYLNTYYLAIVRSVLGFGPKVRDVRDGQRLWDMSPDLLRRLVNLAVVADVFILPVVFFLRIGAGAFFFRPDFIVVEEYFVGVLANYLYAHSYGVLGQRTLNWARRVLAKLLAPGRNHLVVIDCTPKVLRKRWAIRNSLPENMKYVDFQRHLFRRIEDIPEIKNNVAWISRIDGNEDKSSVSMRITDAILGELDGNPDENHSLPLESS
ncbi:MAG: hypothetical protein KAW09_09720 [Thermoplasmata archaeon]|nr:hypothetical protein [Thermoplasmata archaeon]